MTDENEQEFDTNLGEQDNSITGVIERIVYHSEDTGYSICLVDTGRKSTPIATVVGYCPDVQNGETIKASGVWTRHPRHGKQFKADVFACVLPSSKEGIRRFLSNKIMEGIGEKTIDKVLDKFGLSALNILNEEPNRYLEIEGIGKSRLTRIIESWDNNKQSRDALLFISNYGIGATLASKIYKQYGVDTVEVISKNPYRLYDDIKGIGFRKADEIALHMGFERTSLKRITAGIIYVIKETAADGNCYIDENDLIMSANDVLGISSTNTKEALEDLLAARQIIADGQKIYIAHLFYTEKHVAAKLNGLLNAESSFTIDNLEEIVKDAEETSKIQLADMQIQAIEMALKSKVSIITGGPGVGKTTIIKTLVQTFLKHDLKVLLAAPTGRAAKRMEESTRHKAKTLHRLLIYDPKTNTFQKNKYDPLECNVLIVDEASMIDINMMNSILDAIETDTTLLLVGDIDQLPSIGPGNVLRDIIFSGKIPYTALDVIFRQGKGSNIVENAHHINNGEKLSINNSDEFSDFFFFREKNTDKLIDLMVELVSKRVPNFFKFDKMKDIQILSPMRKNRLGADNLNQVVQEVLNPSDPDKPAVKHMGREFRMDDRVMQLTNNYDKDVFNGDIGFIIDIVKQKICVNFDGRDVWYEREELDDLTHAYVSSIHKSQGSEYPAVIILLHKAHYRMLQRNLIYTAVTRGRQLVIIIGDPSAVNMAISNNQIQDRKTTLQKRIFEFEDTSPEACKWLSF
ncbi:MAG: ATP-dependent RecD-like DNA helicase [Kiritimatiellae bacterium]|jgi:exodeoxyribonuclease V alpha subunit|nr:ATP-dependent RecD-like DNA helicase [Kiritimatiellia bacterium]